jgi:large subunit ribosomal protein L21
MYAVIKTGGKQHKVAVGDVIEVEHLVGSGDTVTFHPLLVVDDEGHTHAGSQAAKAVVIAKPLGEKKGDKVKIFKYRPKTGYAKRGGHRQLLTLLEIQDVSLGAEAKRSTKTTPARDEDEESAKDTAEKPATTRRKPAPATDAAEVAE